MVLMPTSDEAAAWSENYWYRPGDPALRLLSAVRRFQRADKGMRRRMGDDMELNATDIEALRHVISHAENGRQVTARDLTSALHISTASTSKLLNRLTESGHLRRVPHPQDRRSVFIEATEHTHDEVRDHLTSMHQRMLDAARAVPAASRQDVVDFLEALTASIEETAEQD